MWPSRLRENAVNVALRKESVDRNYKERPGQKARPKSLSARRAWIEIRTAEIAKTSNAESLSARRAWIEIKIWYCGTSIGLVALRKESVDRNKVSALRETVPRGRSPQGERG